MAVYDITQDAISRITAGDILNCPYSGEKKLLTLNAGKYKLECWGAQGGYRSSSAYGGKGGYSVGTISQTDDFVVHLYVGGSGNTGGAAGGFNGGGARAEYNGGGGATDIRINTDSLYARVIVAGGGGSDGASNKKGMYGGGEKGGSATQSYGTGGYGGGQSGVSNTSWQKSEPSTTTTARSDAYAGFGFGGNGVTRSAGQGGAGGGGWYGGAGVYPDSSGDDDRGGGGGSGFVWTGLNAPEGYLLTSDQYLTDAETIAGDTSFLSPDGVSETGHSGDGYIRITAIEVYKKTPEAPSDFIQTSKDYFSIGLSWNETQETNGYKLYRDSILISTQVTNTYVDNDVQPNKTYLYSVVGFNNYGDGDPSYLTASTKEAFIVMRPIVSEPIIYPNPVNINTSFTLSVQVVEETLILEPYFYYSGEIYSGEVE